MSVAWQYFNFYLNISLTQCSNSPWSNPVSSRHFARCTKYQCSNILPPRTGSSCHTSRTINWWCLVLLWSRDHCICKHYTYSTSIWSPCLRYLKARRMIPRELLFCSVQPENDTTFCIRWCATLKTAFLDDLSFFHFLDKLH